MKSLRDAALAALAAAVAAKAFCGSIDYDPRARVVWVRDFLEDEPATADTILAADRGHGWGVMHYDAAKDVYRLDASLYIGDDKNLGAFFQIGRPGHPRETLVVRGDVWIRPPRKSPLRTDGRPAVVNRLTLGRPKDSSIRATLKIACERRGQFGVHIGIRDKTRWIHGGDLHVYNSVITAAIPDRRHALKSRGWYGSSIRLIRAKLSWVDGAMTYGVNRKNSLIEDTVFEHGGDALRNGEQFVKGCTFRDLQIAVAEGGCLDAVLVNCVFEHNQYNWTLGGAYGRRVRMIDCRIGPQSKPLRLWKNKVDPKRAAMRHIPLYPCYSEWKSLVVKVTDRSGAPVFAAAVNVDCPRDASAVENPLALTDAKGCTPTRLEDGAILIAVKRLRATDAPDRPRAESFLYRVAVQAAGFREKSLALSGSGEIPRPLVVALDALR